MDTRPLDILAFDSSVNASTTRVGLRRRTAVTVGIPLWEELDVQERVALLGHELAHSVNGDIRRSGIVGSSMEVLENWYAMTTPGSLRSASGHNVPDMGGLPYVVAFFLLAVPHALIGLLYRLQLRLTLTNQREAEYLADTIGAQVSGTKASRAMLDRLILSSSISYAVRQATKNGDADTYGAIRAAAFAEELAVDSTHPPTSDRIEAIDGGTFFSPMVFSDASWNERINRELEAVRTQLEPLVRSRLSKVEE